MPSEDYMPDFDPDYENEDVACKHCGQQGLSWLHTGVRWRLIGDDGRFHECKRVGKSAADDFDNLE